MSQINDEFLDVDFEKQPQFVFGDLGLGAFGPRMSSYESAQPTLTSSQIEEEIEKINEAGGGAERLVKYVLNQGREGSCFPPGTLVTMATGEVRPIEDVKCLETVITAENRTGEVRQTMVRPFNGQLVGVHLHGHNLIRSTPEHPYLTQRGYVAAQALTADDFVAIPKVRPVTVTQIETKRHLPTRTRVKNETRTRHFNAPQGRTESCIQVRAMPETIQLDAAFGRIVGLFLAEGNVDQQKVVWTFNHNELDTIVADLRFLLSNTLGLESKLRVNAYRSTAKVEIYGTLWARFFESIGSTGSGKKRLCSEMASGPEDFVRAVFDGWMEGDGNHGTRRNTGVTVSRSLAVQMFQIANRLGMYPSLRRSTPQPTGNVKSRQPRYDLTFSDVNAENYRRHQDSNHCWRKVRMLTREDYDGPVYNIHVHGDESYVADGLGVHNCVANAFTQANLVIQALQFGKHKVVPLSPISLYKRIGRSPGSGAMVSDGIEEMVERGILPLDTPENRARFGSAVMPATGFYEKYPSNWEATAAKFKGGEYHVVKSVDSLFTALCCQHPVVVGREGHSICYLRPMMRNGRRVVMYVNSWGNWGAAGGDFGYGFGFDTESQVRKSASWAVAVRSVVIPSDLK